MASPSVASPSARSPGAGPGGSTSAAPAAGEPRIPGGAWAAAVLLLGVHAALAWVLRAPALTAGHDDALYLNLADALRQLRYVDLHYPHEPVHSQYPPGYPALLALVGALGGDRLDGYLSVGVVWSTLALALAFDLAQRLWGWMVGLAVLAPLALSPALVSGAGGLRSEPVMMGWMLLSIWAVARPAPTRWHLIVAGGAAIAAALTRTIGAALLLGLAVHWLLERRYRALLALILAAAGTVGAWLVWTVLAPEKLVGRNYIADFTEFGVERRGGFLPELLRRLDRTLVIPAMRLPAALQWPAVPGTKLDNLASAALILACVGFGISRLWRHCRVGLLMLACYLGVMAVWPWKLSRFFEPLQPVVWPLVLLGALAIGRRWLARVPWSVAALCTALVLCQSIRADASALAGRRGCDRAAPYQSGCFPAHVRAYFAAARFARDSTPPDARFLSAKDATWHRATGRRVVASLAALARPADELLPYLRRAGVSHVVVGRVKSNEPKLAARLLPVCRELSLLAAYPPDAYVFRLADLGATDGAAACAALRTYLDHRAGGTATDAP